MSTRRTNYSYSQTICYAKRTNLKGGLVSYVFQLLFPLYTIFLPQIWLKSDLFMQPLHFFDSDKKKVPTWHFFHCDVRCYWPCLDPKHLLLNPSNRMFGHMHRVLNKISLQNFLHRWVVNRETNLISILNP